MIHAMHITFYNIYLVVSVSNAYQFHFICNGIINLKYAANKFVPNKLSNGIHLYYHIVGN